MKAMHIITPKLEFVKRKKSEGEKNLAGCVDDFHSSDKGDFSPSVDINLAATKKNAAAGDSDGSDGGKNAPLGRKSGFGVLRGDGDGYFSLLDTLSSDITPQRKRQKREKTGVLSIEQYESRADNCGAYVREFETKCCNKIVYFNMCCNLRSCPYCARKRMLDRTRKVVKFIKSLDANREKYGHRLRFITFGYGTKDGIKKGVEKSLEAFEKIRRNLLETQRVKYVDKWDRKIKRRKTEGCVWSVELGSKNLSVHVHVLYWGKYIPQRVLKKEWKRLTGKFYVDIRYAKNKSKKKKGLWGVVLETTKYITKGLRDLDTETAFRIERELFNIRTFGTSGIFYGKIKPEKLTCPFCGSDLGFFYVDVEEKGLYVMTTMNIQKQKWKELRKARAVVC